MAQQFKHILVPVDFSEACEQATEAAIELFGDQAETITLLTIYEGMAKRHTEMESEVDAMMTDNITEKTQNFAKKFLSKHSGIQAFIKKGHAAEEIIHFAKSKACDLIVMGFQDRKSFARLFAGKATYEEVSRQAPCSVFLFRPC